MSSSLSLYSFDIKYVPSGEQQHAVLDTVFGEGAGKACLHSVLGIMACVCACDPPTKKERKKRNIPLLSAGRLNTKKERGGVDVEPGNG